MFGLKGSGKTTILYRLLLDEIITTIPTIGFNMETFKYNKFSFTITECGGQQPRQGWRHYYSSHNNYHPIDTIIWVTDISKVKVVGFGDRYKSKLIVNGYIKHVNINLPKEIINLFINYCFIKDKNEHDQVDMLHSIINDEELKDAKLLVYANKSDLVNESVTIPTADRIADILRLNDIEHKWHVQPCMAIERDDYGLWEGLDWIING